MNRIIILAIITFFTLPKLAKAQHCHYDGIYIVVIEIKSDQSKLVIPNLKVTLLDSLDNPLEIITQHSKKDTLKILQNPIKKDSLTDDSYFWFAEQNYFFIFETGPFSPRKVPGSKLKIEDVDGKENGGEFKTKTIILTDNDSYPLCRDYSHWDDGEKGGFVKNYAPIQVIMKE